MDKIKLSLISALAIGGGTTIILSWWWWWSREKKLRVPNKWRRVGEISDIFVFPVKSLGFIRKSEIECTPLGCKSGWLRDRTLMLIDLNKKFITARKFPQMIKIKPNIVGSILTLEAPGTNKINIDLSHVGKKFMTSIWSQPVPACDCGDDVAQWLSQFLLQEDTGIRLVYYPLDVPYRDVKIKNKAFPLLGNADAGAYPDESSFSLMTEASVEELNARLEDPVTPLQFRMNFTVKGTKAYEEDTWDWIKIGSVVFRNVRPSTRCLLITIDPDIGEKSNINEPLKTLKKYRQIEDPTIRPFVGESPMLGIHMGLKGPNGMIKLGDSVYVNVSEE
ncbi:hypothetical protein PV328_001480 [Microctonus aethiopoides]|uniref:MOSC domain-containing protein n=1 Tax=Microctonus aethiopoides TaxID=144406 RepID=A0AA39FY77_9HYME|nr:hypothetical protein PV328_001480 [Microctonus aethiopoides]